MPIIPTENPYIVQAFTSPETTREMHAYVRDYINDNIRNIDDLGALLVLANYQVIPVFNQFEDAPQKLFITADILQGASGFAIEKYGNLSVVEAEDRVTKLAGDALTAYNTAHPDEQLDTMPLLVTSDRALSTSYNRITNVLTIDEGLLVQLDDKDMTLVLAHELRHAWQARNLGVSNHIPDLDGNAFVREQNELATICLDANISREDMARALQATHEGVTVDITVENAATKQCNDKFIDYRQTLTDVGMATQVIDSARALALEEDAHQATIDIDPLRNAQSMFAVMQYADRVDPNASLAEVLTTERPHYGKMEDFIKRSGCDIIYDGENADLVCPSTPSQELSTESQKR